MLFIFEFNKSVYLARYGLSRQNKDKILFMIQYIDFFILNIQENSGDKAFILF